ncbi:hypothetical protein BDP27DRAFT_1319252 [Rhodocollybia butyracea]|uniref:Uncharacterized protein n=1 Tax=Rhodocollybia butyracea TaxID=206335 RepID=A0A9P5Q1M4_9AGAR|nr:hypothetical protein BDP27DRAFT_1319252 [Rhodocollybia butyracea]
MTFIVATTALGIGALLFICLHRKIFSQHMLREIQYSRYPISRIGSSKFKGTAVICGGSLSGLLSAAVCASYFEDVIVVESEDWLSISADATTTTPWKQKHIRSHVMQYHQTQSIQVYTYLSMKKILPNLDSECMKFDMRLLPANFNLYLSGQPAMVPYEHYDGSLPSCIFGSRQGLETLIRRIVLDKTLYPNITQISGSVTKVEPDSIHRKYLHQISVSQKDKALKLIAAALVVDCTGSSQAGLKMVDSDGHSIASVRDVRLQYDPAMRFSTFKFPIPDVLSTQLPVPGGFANVGPIYNCMGNDHFNIWSQRVEGNIFMICCGGWGVETVPRDLAEIINYANAMNVIIKEPIPLWFFSLLERLRDHEAAATLSCVRVPACYFNQLHKVVNIPSNFVALGDSVMRVNPIYAQGCTKLVMGVLCLQDMLDSARNHPTENPDFPLSENFSKFFFAEQNRRIEPIWKFAKTNDYGYVSTVPISGEKLSNGAYTRWYWKKLSLIGLKDREVASVLWQIKMFLAPPASYYRPHMMWKAGVAAITGVLTNS